MSDALHKLAMVFDWIRHVDQHLHELVQQFGVWVYAVIGGIIFFETAFVILPFLPGDSLLIPVGLVCQTGEINIWAVLIIVPLCAMAGDFINYHIGKYFGARLFTETSKGIFRKENLIATREFYEQHGSKAIIVARFVPIVRALAPFVAGMEGMPKRKFIPISAAAAFLWVWTCVFVGFFFGKIPLVKDNFEVALLVLFLIMAMGIIIERKIHSILKARKAAAKLAATAVEPGD